MTHAIESPESVGMSSRRLERVQPAMQAYVDQGVYAGIVTLMPELDLRALAYQAIED